MEKFILKLVGVFFLLYLLIYFVPSCTEDTLNYLETRWAKIGRSAGKAANDFKRGLSYSGSNSTNQNSSSQPKTDDKKTDTQSNDAAKEREQMLVIEVSESCKVIQNEIEEIQIVINNIEKTSITVEQKSDILEYKTELNNYLIKVEVYLAKLESVDDASSLERKIKKLKKEINKLVEEIEILYNTKAIHDEACYYVVGDESMLLENDIVEKDSEGNLVVKKSGWNKDFFIPGRVDDLRKLPINAAEALVLSDMPAGSYTITGKGTLFLEIKDKNEFWSRTDYLVILTK